MKVDLIKFALSMMQTMLVCLLSSLRKALSLFFSFSFLSSLSFSWFREPVKNGVQDKASIELVLLSCLLVLAPHAMHFPLWISLLCSLLLLWRAWITVRGKRLPSRWILVPMLMLSMMALYGTYQTFSNREASVAVLAILLAFKLIEMQTRFDLFVVIYSSFFLMLANFLYSQTVVVVLMMLLAIILLFTVQLSLQYSGAMAALRRRFYLSALMALLAMPLAGMLFLFFPRIQENSFWNSLEDAHAAQAGLPTSMAPGTISNLALSDDVAFRVKFFDSVPSANNLYWRGVVLGNYDGRTWTQIQNPNTQQSVSLTTRGMPIRHQITLEANRRNLLLALETPKIAPEVNGHAAKIMPDRQIVLSVPIDQRVRYEAVSYLDYSLQANASPSDMQDWLAIPPGLNPRTLQLAEKLRQQLRSSNRANKVHNVNNEELILLNAVIHFFHQNKFRYTLEPPLLGENAVDDFLFSTRSGFCEHYAGAFVILMRALHVPARVVTGYQGGELNPVDGYLTVRQSNAHAWAEIWVEKRGWMRVDPVVVIAPERIETDLKMRGLHSVLQAIYDMTEHGWLAKVRMQIHMYRDTAVNAWNQWLLNVKSVSGWEEEWGNIFNPLNTFNTFSTFNKFTTFNALDKAEFNWRKPMMWIAILLIVLPIILIGLRLRKKTDSIDVLYVSLCQRMALRGYPREINEGPQAYASRLSKILPAENPKNIKKKAAVVDFLRIYEAMKYGSHLNNNNNNDNNDNNNDTSTRTLKYLLSQC